MLWGRKHKSKSSILGMFNLRCLFIIQVTVAFMNLKLKEKVKHEDICLELIAQIIVFKALQLGKIIQEDFF